MREYRVKIFYREPTYEARSGQKASPYSWSYTVSAQNESEAIEAAVQEFHNLSRLSGVGWVKHIVSIEVL